ncbi:hypothetical protein KKB83_04205 [Patescibacteria group bacterium]|nr:hypothetical protein [Patescibacteria group bacterium]
MNVLCDFHHAGLLNSLILLFERRLGWKVYRPIGRQWFDEGYWKVYDHPATVAQFLDVNGATPDNTDPVNDVITGESGVYICHDISSLKTNRAITLDKFREMNFGIIIASIPKHVEPFKKLCKEHWSRPKLIFQIGNQWVGEAEKADNIMCSSRIAIANKNSVVYHQEFDTNVFSRASSEVFEPNITSLVNCFSNDGMFKEDWELFQKVEKLMPEWNFKCMGGQCRDGQAHGEAEVAKTIAKAGFIWHTKKGGDGYGHIIHNASACGRPMIVKKEYYSGKLGEDLMIDGKTCVCIDGLNPLEIKNKIEYYSRQWKELCNNSYYNFKNKVDFDKEEKIIRHFLSKLI